MQDQGDSNESPIGGPFSRLSTMQVDLTTTNQGAHCSTKRKQKICPPCSSLSVPFSLLLRTHKKKIEKARNPSPISLLKRPNQKPFTSSLAYLFSRFFSQAKIALQRNLFLPLLMLHSFLLFKRSSGPPLFSSCFMSSLFSF